MLRIVEGFLKAPIGFLNFLILILFTLLNIDNEIDDEKCSLFSI